MNLRRTIFGALAGAALVALVAPQGVDAQIGSNYSITIAPRIYQPMIGRGTQIPRNDFVDLINGLPDPDNGTAGPITLPFPFEYNGQTFTQIYINVNGWISFVNPLTTGGAGYISQDPEALFNSTRPNLTLAPYFGDHYLRTPGFDNTDPQGRSYTPSSIRYVETTVGGRRAIVFDWFNLNINYNFDPNDPNNPFAPLANVRPQATSIGSFQVWLIEGAGTGGCRPEQGDIEFHYGAVGNQGIVKTSGASVGIEDAPAVPLGGTTFINAVAFAQTGGNVDSTEFSHRKTTVFPPTNFPSQSFVFTSRCVNTIGGWGDGDADLTQLDPNAPNAVKQDQRLFVNFLDVIRILRHQATRTVAFDPNYGRHGFHGDVNHNGRYFFSTRNFDNTADSVDGFGNIIRYVRYYPIKNVNPELPLPNDNSFSGFLFDADQHDAALIMLYLSAKLPRLPWLPDTLPPFTGKAAAGSFASDIRLGQDAAVVGRRVEIPITFDGYLNGAMGVGMEAANGTRIIEIRPATRTNEMWVEAIATDNRVALAAAGTFRPEDVVATLVVEANENGDVTFEGVKVGENEMGVRKFNVFGATSGVGTTGAAGELSLSQNFPNPFNAKTSIAYAVPADGQVTLRVFDVLGHPVATLVDRDEKAGSYTAEWDGRDASGKDVPAGIYLCRIESDGHTRTISMQVVK